MTEPLNAEALHLGCNDAWVRESTALHFFPRIAYSGKVMESHKQLIQAVESGQVRAIGNDRGDGKYTHYNLWDCIRQCNIR